MAVDPNDERTHPRMAAYADIKGNQVWYDHFGGGDPLVLLHPGLVDARALGLTSEVLARHFHVFTPERRGHGRTPDVPGDITFEAMGDDTAEFVEQVVGEPTVLVGVSDGATVAAVTAAIRPDLVRQVVCIAGPAHRDGWLPEAIDPENTPPDFFAASYGELSPDGVEHFPVVVRKMAAAHLAGPTLEEEDLGRIACRALVMVADDDEVTLEHAVALYRALPHGELAVVPGTSHGLLVEKPELCHQIILDFLLHAPVDTLAPVRRRNDR